MELKTKVTAKEGDQNIFVTREFSLPVESLFTAFIEPDIIEQWMGTTVVRLECREHGSYRYESPNPRGDKLVLSGVIHRFIPDQKIIRTFEMEGMPFGVQLELFDFETIGDNKSRLSKQIIYQSVAHRDKNLELPFKQGINWAHNKLEEIITKMVNNGQKK